MCGTDSTVNGGVVGVQIVTCSWWRVVCRTNSTVNSGVVGVQIATVLLVKSSVWNLQYGKVWGFVSADWYSVVGEG